jgi:hypothetical protein
MVAFFNQHIFNTFFFLKKILICIPFLFQLNLNWIFNSMHFLSNWSQIACNKCHFKLGMKKKSEHAKLVFGWAKKWFWPSIFAHFVCRGWVKRVQKKHTKPSSSSSSERRVYITNVLWLVLPVFWLANQTHDWLIGPGGLLLVLSNYLQSVTPGGWVWENGT